MPGWKGMRRETRRKSWACLLDEVEEMRVVEGVALVEEIAAKIALGEKLA